jgi:hypothetical protein
MTEDTETARGSRRVSWRVVAVAAIVVAALGYSWVASGLRPFTHPEAVAVSIPLVVSGIAVLRSRPGGRDAAQVRPRGLWVWAALFAALMAWELISFALKPRADHPTLSSIADAVMSTHPGRFAMFAAWLAVGFWLFRR